MSETITSPGKPHAVDYASQGPLIEIANLTKRYPDVEALRGVSFSVEPGSIVGFLGPNGAGKTTTIRILMGLIKATSGRASIMGQEVSRNPTGVRSEIGYLPGDVRFYEWMTGAAFLAFCNQMRGGNHEDEIERLRIRFDLNITRKIRDYSRGMKQKLGLMQAMMHRPSLLILDEPTTGLDPLVQQVLYEELRSHVGRGGGVLFSSHTLSEVESLCDRVLIIRQGLIIEDSAIADLRLKAVRHVSFKLKSAKTADSLPEGLAGSFAQDEQFSGSWKGPVQNLLSWLAERHVVDAIIESPSLEELFSAYYRGDDEKQTGRRAQP